MAGLKEASKTITSGVYTEGRKKVRDVASLRFIAMLDAVQEHLGILRDREIEELAPVLFSPFHDEVQSDGCHETKSYLARDDGYTAKVSFTRKRSDVELKAEDRRKLAAAGITLPAPSGPRFGIKSEYLKDDGIMDKLQKLMDLGAEHGINLPDDFIEPQTQKVTLDDNTILSVLGMKDFQKVYALLPVIGKINVKDCALSNKTSMVKAAREITAVMVEDEKRAANLKRVA